MPVLRPKVKQTFLFVIPPTATKGVSEQIP